MAVSGRKQTDMLGSVAAGSAKVFDHTCEPCNTIGQHIEAHGFCVQCQEYLCITCLDVHKRSKLSRSHKILGQDEFDRLHTTSTSYNECTELCQFHHKEIIKFYCPIHNVLGCNDCMTIGHRTCKIDYIPDKCTDIADSKQYKDIMEKLSEKLREAEEVCKKAETSRSNIHDINKEVIKKIEEFRKEINDRLDQMQQDILNKVEDKNSNNKVILQKVIETCRGISSDVKKLESSLRANQSDQNNGQLYIDIKRAEFELESNALTEADEKLNNVNTHFSFRRSTDLENLLSKEIAFGELINHPLPTRLNKIIGYLTIKDDINVKTKSHKDKQQCWITGCAVLPPNKLILADYNNNKLKEVCLEENCGVRDKILDTYPWDIAVTSEYEFAVTMPDARRIDVMTTDDKLSCVRSIPVNGVCCGIDCHQDRLYVVCINPSCVVVLTTHGNVLNTIPINFLSNHYVHYIAMRKDANLLYISDYDNSSIVGISLQGDATATYKHGNLQEPCGICLLDDGSLLVCCINGTIHQVKCDLKEGKIMSKDIVKPRSICYNAYHDVYVGCFGNKVKVLNIK